ncbi:MAG: 4Fe-4S binding protein [Desulfobacterales bacterium]|nr:4Fe-4S binding protein [Desulfobacterales bacterium]
MKWSSEAEAAIKKVPFFVRKKVRARVEKEATAEGKATVTMSEVNTTRKRFLTNMNSEVRGYQVDTCFGTGGCPNKANDSEKLLQRIEELIKKEDLLSFLKKRVRGDLKFHHEFRVTLADCPNACSQPQIKDIGIIGADEPFVTDEVCTLCNACVDACKEDAVLLNTHDEIPEIDFQRCLRCGQCIKDCPTGTISGAKKGYRVQLGGKLGRHPRLAKELPGIYSEDEVVKIVNVCIDFYKKNSIHGERFAEIMTDDDFQRISRSV